ncbi:MAG: hypothetical protein AAGF01_24400 [Cyanobacteria bacterium P01_G01_bin.38]
MYAKETVSRWANCKRRHVCTSAAAIAFPEMRSLLDKEYDPNGLPG